MFKPFISGARAATSREPEPQTRATAAPTPTAEAGRPGRSGAGVGSGMGVGCDAQRPSVLPPEHDMTHKAGTKAFGGQSRGITVTPGPELSQRQSAETYHRPSGER